MKKAILILVLGLLWCNVGFAVEEEDKFSEFENVSQTLNLRCLYNTQDRATYDYAYNGKLFYLDGWGIEIGPGSEGGGVKYELSQKGKKPIFLLELNKHNIYDDVGNRTDDGQKTVEIKHFVDFTKKTSHFKSNLIQAQISWEGPGQCYVP